MSATFHPSRQPLKPYRAMSPRELADHVLTSKSLTLRECTLTHALATQLSDALDELADLRVQLERARDGLRAA